MPRFSISKQVTRQLQAAERVISSASELAEPIAAAIAAKLGPAQQPGDPLIDWRQLQDVCARVLRDSADRLRRLDETHAGLDATGQLLRNRRDEAVVLLREELRRVRYYFDKTLPKEDVKDILPQRRIISSLDPANLVRLGKHLTGLLRAELVGARTLVAASPSQPSAELLAQGLEGAVAAVEATLEALEPELRKRSLAYDQKGREKEEALDAWRRTRDLLAGIYRVAGFDYLVEQLRVPSQRKKATEPGKEETPATPAVAEPPAAPPADIGFRV